MEIFYREMVSYPGKAKINFHFYLLLIKGMPTLVAIGFLSFVCCYDFRLVEITIQSSGSRYLVLTYCSCFCLYIILLFHIFFIFFGITYSDLKTNPGEDVTVEDEVVVINSIVLPHKTLNVSVQEEIIL